MTKPDPRWLGTETSGRVSALIQDFEQDVRSGTSDINAFRTLDDLEGSLSGLVQKTTDEYRDLFEQLVNDIDEKDLIRKKKQELKPWGIKLRNHGKRSRQILTEQGMITYTRTMLIPKDAYSRQMLMDRCGCTTIFPLDEILGIDRLPLKMTIRMLLKCAYIGQEAKSYQAAEEILLKLARISVGDDTIRYATNYVGKLVFEDQVRRADEIKKLYDSGKLEFGFSRKGILYIETDGAMFNTCPGIDGTYTQGETGRRVWVRNKEYVVDDKEGEDDDSSWRENKMGIVFSSDNIHNWTGRNGERRHRILKREYVSYIGTKDIFQWHLFECAFRNGYGMYEKTVILSDGGKWIKSMAQEIFPDAIRILDLYHLKENVYDFAKGKFNNEESKYTPWAEEVCKMIENGQWKRVLEEKIKEGERYKGCVDLYQYILDNQDAIDYPTYRELGYYVGSGAVESANKSVMQCRLKLQGMMWEPEFAQYVLALRTRYESDLWETGVCNLIRSILLCQHPSYQGVSAHGESG